MQKQQLNVRFSSSDMARIDALLALIQQFEPELASNRSELVRTLVRFSLGLVEQHGPPLLEQLRTSRSPGASSAPSLTELVDDVAPTASLPAIDPLLPAQESTLEALADALADLTLTLNDVEISELHMHELLILIQAWQKKLLQLEIL